MKTIKSIALTLALSSFLLIGINGCKKDVSDDKSSSTTSQPQEDLTSANAMDDAMNKMGIYDDSLAHTSDHHHQLHYDSLYHHHDSLFTHHHNVYHHGDTIHHYTHHTQVQHHVIDSLHTVHTPHHP